MCGAGSASIVPFEHLYMQPSLIKNGDMKEYQLEGLSRLVYWHKNNISGILGDEMGLGKTLQTLSLFAYIREHEPENDLPHIIVCPLSVLQNWMDEVKRWLPSFKIIQFHGATKERAELKRQLATQNFQLLVTNYESVKAEAGWLKSRRWNYIVLDEGHRIKNSDTGVSHTLQYWKSQHRLLLSGTAVQNKLLELWGLLHWLHPLVFTDATAARFDQAFQLSRGQYNLGMIEAAQKFLQIIMLRRTKADVELTVPPKEERTVFLPLRTCNGDATISFSREWTCKLTSTATWTGTPSAMPCMLLSARS
ncbi:hypothetical protein AURDEDRAFT_98285 [Auricularia subglabra TFB-10046 SS5]|nr:hypothetical protein AURDEDRAFT_98285 [Auricularia subglabra TFB-10046 SS5]